MGENCDCVGLPSQMRTNASRPRAQPFSRHLDCFFVVHFLFPPSWPHQYPLCSCNFQAMKRFFDSVNTLMYSTVPVPWCMSSCKTLTVLEFRRPLSPVDALYSCTWDVLILYISLPNQTRLLI